MTMNTRKTFIAAATAAVMACSAAHAQVLGGNVGGALNGTLGGGLHDSNVLTTGGASGSFGGQLDTGSTFDSTMGRARGVADQTGQRARNAGANVRNRAQSTVGTARVASANGAAPAAATAQATSSEVAAPKDTAPKLDTLTSDVSGSASGNASASREDGIVADAAADATGVASMEANKKEETPEPAPQPTPRRERDTSNQ
jgi:hypothetical protein